MPPRRYYTRELSPSRPLLQYFRSTIGREILGGLSVAETEAQLKRAVADGEIEIKPAPPSSWQLRQVSEDRFDIETPDGPIDAKAFQYCQWIDVTLPGRNYGRERLEILLAEPTTLESMLAESELAPAAPVPVKPMSAEEQQDKLVADAIEWLTTVEKLRGAKQLYMHKCKTKYGLGSHIFNTRIWPAACQVAGVPPRVRRKRKIRGEPRPKRRAKN